MINRRLKNGLKVKIFFKKSVENVFFRENRGDLWVGWEKKRLPGGEKYLAGEKKSRERKNRGLKIVGKKNASRGREA